MSATAPAADGPNAEPRPPHGHGRRAARPVPDLPRTAYAATVEGNGQAPRFRDGDVLIIDPERPPAPGDMVVFWPIDETTRAELRRLGAVHVVVGALGPSEVRKIEAAPARLKL